MKDHLDTPLAYNIHLQVGWAKNRIVCSRRRRFKFLLSQSRMSNFDRVKSSKTNSRYEESIQVAIQHNNIGLEIPSGQRCVAATTQFAPSLLLLPLLLPSHPIHSFIYSGEELKSLFVLQSYSWLLLTAMEMEEAECRGFCLN